MYTVTANGETNVIDRLSGIKSLYSMLGRNPAILMCHSVRDESLTDLEENKLDILSREALST